jgi:hypothetical protein
MKKLNDFITEGRYDAEYRVSLVGCNDEYDLPLGVTILVNKSNRREFEKWLEDQQDNAFIHAEGGSVEY